jgi:hypothetical protein
MTISQSKNSKPYRIATYSNFRAMNLIGEPMRLFGVIRESDGAMICKGFTKRSQAEAACARFNNGEI